MNKHVALLIFVILFASFGLVVCGIDLYHNHVLHVISAIVGGGSLLVAVGLALPIEMKEVVTTLAPFLDRLRPSK